MNKKITLGLLMFFCSSSAVLAEAVSYSPSWYIAPSLNNLSPGGEFGVDEDNKFAIEKDDVGVGIRVGTAISPTMDIQFGTTYARVRDGVARYQQNLLGVDALYMFSRQNFRPFILVGAGAEYDKRDIGGAKTSETSPYINAGLGFQYAFNDKLALQADYRRVHGFIQGDGFGFDSSNNDYLTVGVNFAFGAR